MKTSRTLLLAACFSLAIPAPAAAANSAYDLFIVACDTSACKRVAEQTVSSGLASFAEYNRHGLKLMLETISRRTNEEDTKISLDVRPGGDNAAAWRTTPTSLAQRIETFVITLKHGTFMPLATFVSEGTTYQVWARLAAIR